MAELTAAQYAQQLRGYAIQIKDGQALQRAAQSVHADRVERIFDTGSVARGYNTTDELWVADKNLCKNGSHVGKTGKKIKTTYFKSYYDLKEKQGFDPNTVNFRLTNDLQMDFANSRVNPGTGGVDSGKVIKVSNELFVEELRSDKNVEKLKGNIERFGNFIEFTSKEVEDFNRIIELELTATINGER